MVNLADHVTMTPVTFTATKCLPHFQLLLCVFSFNPLWGHCQEYKIQKIAILQECLLSEKRSAFAYYNLTLSESFCLTDHDYDTLVI